MKPSRLLRTGLACLGCLVAGWSLANPTSAVANQVEPAWLAQLDQLVRQGDDWPDEALLALSQHPTPSDVAGRRGVALARAVVLARAGDGPDNTQALEAATAAVQAAALQVSGALAAADVSYLKALKAERGGGTDPLPIAQQALAAYQRHCTAPPMAADLQCEYRPRWRLLHLMAMRALARLDDNATQRHAQAALALAAAAGDAWRQASTLGLLAMVETLPWEVRERHLELADAWALRAGDVGARARTRLVAAQLQLQRGRLADAQAVMAEALSLARQARAARLESAVLGNLSELNLRRQAPAAALAAAETGLLTARRLADRRLERLLLNNAMLAHVALGHSLSAHLALEALQRAWAAEGNTGAQVSSLREFSDALGAAGDLPGALAAYHRERQLNQQLSQANQAAALAELRQRYDSDAEQRNLHQLARDNALKQTELDNQGLVRGLWLLGGVVLTLALAVVGLLLLRVRETNRQLSANQARLKLQSERDVLTGLANRRHLQVVLQASTDAQTGYTGSLLMLDIDHFKAINDQQGHAAGDAVLVEVARRIAAHVRAEDTVARWGGEEFLVHAPGLSLDEARQLASRLLNAVAGVPMPLPGGAMHRVTASVGHARFPLQPSAVPARPEQAINLVDMALYEAKGRGRNRAVGLLSADVVDAAGLVALEADFERACSEGRVVVDTQLGPPSPSGALPFSP